MLPLAPTGLTTLAVAGRGLTEGLGFTGDRLGWQVVLNEERPSGPVEAHFDALLEGWVRDPGKCLRQWEPTEFRTFGTAGEGAPDAVAPEQEVAEFPLDVLEHAAEGRDLDDEACLLVDLTNGSRSRGFALFNLTTWHLPATAR